LPSPGETILGKSLVIVGGGKGANQAIAAARLGAEVALVTRVGHDDFGRRSLSTYTSEGLNTDWVVFDDEEPSGVALIMVDDEGQNIISVAQGANARLEPADVDRASRAISQADCILMQLEIPLDTVKRAIEIAKGFAVPVLLNPAPATPLSKEFLSGVDILTPNEPEAEVLAGLKISDLQGANLAADKLASLGVRIVVMTLGEKGALTYANGQHTLHDGFRVSAVDATGAGDAFSAALAVATAKGLDLHSAVRYANAGAAISVTRLGAQPSLPSAEDVDSFLASQG
jgi:ribokinase